MAHQRTKTLTFADSTAIREVQVKTSTNMINAIAFLDKNGLVVESYAAQESDGSQEDHSLLLEGNEEIFGLYGVKDASDHFTSFGLIAKVIPVVP